MSVEVKLENNQMDEGVYMKCVWERRREEEVLEVEGSGNGESDISGYRLEGLGRTVEEGAQGYYEAGS